MRAMRAVRACLRCTYSCMDQLRQRCKQEWQLRSHWSTVQLHATSGNMVSWLLHGDGGSDGGASESTSEGVVHQRLGVLR